MYLINIYSASNRTKFLDMNVLIVSGIVRALILYKDVAVMLKAMHIAGLTYFLDENSRQKAKSTCPRIKK